MTGASKLAFSLIIHSSPDICPDNSSASHVVTVECYLDVAQAPLLVFHQQMYILMGVVLERSRCLVRAIVDTIKQRDVHALY